MAVPRYILNLVCCEYRAKAPLIMGDTRSLSADLNLKLLPSEHPRAEKLNVRGSEYISGILRAHRLSAALYHGGRASNLVDCKS